MILGQPEILHQRFTLLVVKDFFEQNYLRTSYHSILFSVKLATGAFAHCEEGRHDREIVGSFRNHILAEILTGSVWNRLGVLYAHT